MSLTIRKEFKGSESALSRKLCITIVIEEENNQKPDEFERDENLTSNVTTTRVSNTGATPVRIIHVQNSLDHGWFVTLVRSNRVVRGTDSQQTWTSWNPIHKNDAFVYVFGLPDPENDGQFLYAFGNENDNLVRLMTGKKPANEINDADLRLFRHLVSNAGKRNILQHVVSGKYVAVSEKSANRVVLRDSEEEASEVVLQFEK